MPFETSCLDVKRLAWTYSLQTYDSSLAEQAMEALPTWTFTLSGVGGARHPGGSSQTS